MLKASQELQSSDDDEEVRQEDEIDDRSKYETDDDAKRHANKTFLHEHVW